MTKQIKFISSYKEYISPPRPALNFIPEVYKKMKRMIDDTCLELTVKQCMPFLDALTTGYIIPFPIDLQFKYDLNKKEWKFFHPPIPSKLLPDFEIQTHGSKQIDVNLLPSSRTLDQVFKFQNQWIIKTPPGYSCLITTPLNQNVPFEIITGVVVTDTYPHYINLPFCWMAPLDQVITMKQGEPMAMVFPFKRESWKMKIEKDMPKNDEFMSRLKNFSSLLNNYKNRFWSKKTYK